jgi:hypothetical protein
LTGFRGNTPPQTRSSASNGLQTKTEGEDTHHKGYDQHVLDDQKTQKAAGVAFEVALLSKRLASGRAVEQVLEGGELA